MLSLAGLAALAALLVLPSGISFARRSVRPLRSPQPLVVAHAPEPPLVAPVEPAPAHRPTRPVATASPRPFGGVPGKRAVEPKRKEGHVEGAILDEAGEPLVASIAAVPVGGGDAVYVDSDPAGRFQLALPPGTYTFSVYSKGDVAPEVIEALPVEAGEQLHGLVVQLPPGAFDHDDCDALDLDYEPERYFDDNPDLTDEADSDI